MLARLIPLLLAAPAIAGEIVVPNAAATQAGPGGYSTLLNSAARSYQLVVGPSELSGIPAGSRITGIAWRRPSWQAFAAWPGTGFACTFANYDITLSDSPTPTTSPPTPFLSAQGPWSSPGPSSPAAPSPPPPTPSARPSLSPSPTPTPAGGFF
jgi:hypothetical protein